MIEFTWRGRQIRAISIEITTRYAIVRWAGYCQHIPIQEYLEATGA